MRQETTTDERRGERLEEDTLALYRALHNALDEETADRLFPAAWRHLRKIRSGSHGRGHAVVHPPRDADRR